jgi:hypothetical protein
VGLLIAALMWGEWVAIESIVYHWQERHVIKLDALILATFYGASLLLLAIGVRQYLRRNRGR